MMLLSWSLLLCERRQLTPIVLPGVYYDCPCPVESSIVIRSNHSVWITAYFSNTEPCFWIVEPAISHILATFEKCVVL